ncbi:MAG: lactate utilization protein [Oscillospiraceae bacterium]|nr:lactate utilization protein [Oscillospiraceae bacterium]
MDNNRKAVLEKQIEKVIKALEKNNMQGFYAEDSCKAVELVKTILNKGDVVSFGGSMTLNECGIFDLLKNGDYTLLDRNAEGNTPEDIQRIYRESFSADTYLCSSNAITENGELYNVDGLGNRVTALTFGPKSVIVIAGYNKIVADLDAAIHRVKTVAAPANCLRLNKDTYCAKCGQCVSITTGKTEMTDGCYSPARICRHYIVTAKQPMLGRIKVILVGEELGY